MYIIGQILISRGPSCVAVNRTWALTHLPSLYIGPLLPPRDVTALCLATPRGLCRAIRRPPNSGAGIDSGCSSLKFGFEAAGPIYLSDFFIPGSTFGGGVSLGDRKPNIGRKYALVPGLTTPLYNVTLALFEEVPPTP